MPSPHGCLKAGRFAPSVPLAVGIVPLFQASCSFLTGDYIDVIKQEKREGDEHPSKWPMKRLTAHR